MRGNLWVVLGALLGGLGVAAGGFGAHVLEDRWSPEMLDTYEKAVRYQLVHALALVLVGMLVSRAWPAACHAAGGAFLVGVLLFSGCLYLWLFTAVKPFVYVVPVGGVSLLIGWAASSPPVRACANRPSPMDEPSQTAAALEITPPERWAVVVVGAGAAGLLAAASAAERGRRTLLLEKNRKPGAKILMSGGTRCNLTHATDNRGIVEAFGPQGRFLHSALSAFGPHDVVEMFEAEGVATKVEPATGKIFPASDRALDVLGALLRRLRAERLRRWRARSRWWSSSAAPRAFGWPPRGARSWPTSVILTPGGQSYPGCGTTGDGYAWAAALGHTIVPPRPALVPLRTDAAWVHASCKGITIPDVLVQVIAGERPARRASRTQSVPPRARRAARLVPVHAFRALRPGGARREPRGERPLRAGIARPGLRFPARRSRPAKFDALLARQCRSRREAAGRHDPGRLAAAAPGRGARRAALGLAGRTAARRNSPRPSAARLVSGGQSGCRSRSPARWASRRPRSPPAAWRSTRSTRAPCRASSCPDLYIAGELLDLDGPIGGYNFQAAFSTGWLAGAHA